MPRLFTPFSGYVLNSAYMGVLLFLFSVLLGSLPYAIGWYAPAHSGALEQTNGLWNFYGSVVVAPILETLIMTILYLIIVKWRASASSGFVIAVAAFAAAAHWSRTYYAIVMAVLAFSFLSFEYLYLCRTQNTPSATIGVTLTHSINNLLVYVLAVSLASI